jgi:hypothetical protein
VRIAALGAFPARRPMFGKRDPLTLIRGGQTWKFGGDFRPEEFTIFQPAAPRGQLDFGPVYTDNPAQPGTGGSGCAVASRV